MVTIALIGAGMRGTHAYGAYVLDHADKAQFFAVADPDQQTRQRFQKLHNIPEERCFQDWEDLLKQPRLADAVIISTPDSTHYKPTMAAIEKGYHILLEKPMSTDPIECITMGEYAKQREQVFAVCHVLRYAGFFKSLKALLLSGQIGKLVSIQHNENVGYRHYAHSYVRGNWRNSDLSSPMILAKSCHDMDILLWLVDTDCESVSSFGELSYFKEENAPKNAPMRCTDGCPVEAECPYSAQKHYLTDNLDWFTNTISIDTSLKA
ncbi:MAG: oxidoreductase, partial [Chloroflexi bacterium HGW-Chloroflexi-7]